MDDYDVYGLSEVGTSDLYRYAPALGKSFKAISGRNKYEDHLQLIYNAFALTLVRSKELDSYDGIEMNNGNHRSPLMAHFKTREGLEFQARVA